MISSSFFNHISLVLNYFIGITKIDIGFFPNDIFYTDKKQYHHLVKSFIVCMRFTQKKLKAIIVKLSFIHGYYISFIKWIISFLSLLKLRVSFSVEITPLLISDSNLFNLELIKIISSLNSFL